MVDNTFQAPDRICQKGEVCQFGQQNAQQAQHNGCSKGEPQSSGQTCQKIDSDHPGWLAVVLQYIPHAHLLHPSG